MRFFYKWRYKKLETWLNREREKLKHPDGRTREEVQKMFATQPLKGYLVALMDEMVRQGIFLNQIEQEGVKRTLETIKKEIEKGEEVMRQENKRKQ